MVWHHRGLADIVPSPFVKPEGSLAGPVGGKNPVLNFFPKEGGAVFKKKAVVFSKNRELNFGNGRFKPLIFFPNLACPSLKMKKTRQNPKKKQQKSIGGQIHKNAPPSI